MKIPREDIISLTISKNAGNLPVDGIAKSELSVSFLYDGNLGAAAAAPVRIYIDEQLRYQKFYIYTRKMRNGIVSLECFDKMMQTAQPFDITNISAGSDGMVFVSSVLLQLTAQCGFKSLGAYPNVMQKIKYDELVGASCDDILTMLSQVFCGVWYTETEDDDETLRFNTFGATTEMVFLDDAAYSEIVTGSVKGPIERIVASNSTEVFDTGGITDFMKTLKISGKLFTEKITKSLLEVVSGATYTAFEIEKTNALTDAHICCGVILGELTFVACRIEISISAGGIITGFSAADICEPEWDYTGAINRKIKNKVDYNSPSAGTYFTRSEGLKIEGDYAVITAADGKMIVYKKPAEAEGDDING